METLDAAYTAARPALTPEGAAILVSERWGLAGRAIERPSERDRVFEIVDESKTLGFLKVANALETRTTLERQRAMLEALASGQSCYRIPTWRPGLEGETLVDVELDGRAHLLRLVDPVPGRPISDVRPRTSELWRQVGRLLGIFDRTMLELPAAERALVWDLRGAADLVAARLDEVVDEERRTILERILERHAAGIAPRATELRTSWIHNDANPANLFVDAERPGTPKVVGLVDFGDATFSWTVAEPAVACAYAGFGASDPVGVFCRIAGGYASEHPLLEPEADVLYDLARLRLALSVVISAVRTKQDPENRYLEVSAVPAWRLLERLDREPPDLARYRLREACGFVPCPASVRVVRALERAAGGAGALLDPDPRAAPTLTLDLSVASGDDGGTFDPSDHAAFGQRLFDAMRDADAAIGIGRYDEVRWWYTGEAFRSAGIDADEWRTVHLGLDLFAPPGTPVHAPLAGRLIAARDNDERLDYGPTLVVEHELEDDEGPVRFWTLYGHLSPESLERGPPGRRVEAGEPIAEIGGPPRNGDWAPHLHFQIIADLLGHEGTFPGVAAPSQRDVWCSVSPDPQALLRLSGETTAPRPRPIQTLIEDRRGRLGPSLSLSYRRPLHIVRGRGSRLYDADGQPYLDCVNNVAHVGHSHPVVTRAATRQMGLLNTNTRYLHESILAYTERLGALLPDPLEVFYLVTSGTEANELALRMARTHTGKVGAVVLEGAYHGHACSVINLSPYKFRGPGGKGVRPWVRVAPMPDPYRGAYREGEPDLGAKYAADVARAAEALETEPTWFGDRPPGAAAFFHESLQSCAGQIPLPSGFLPAAYEAVRARGGVCVADEVQVGFGRVGSHFWAFEEHGVVPDILTLGKPIGNGHPLAAVVTTREIAASFDNGMEFFSTFGGNPVSCEIGLAVLDVIEREALQENAARVGARLMRDLEDLRDRHLPIGDVRGRGLFVGIELVRDRETREPDAATADGVVQRMRDRGILLSTDGPDHNVIKFKPPMVFSEADAELLVSHLDDILSETAFTG